MKGNHPGRILYFGLVAVFLVVGVGFVFFAMKTGSKPEEPAGGTEVGAPGASRQTARHAGPEKMKPPIHLPRLDEAGRRALESDPGADLLGYCGKDGEDWTLAAEDLLVAWAARDPEAAMQWIRTAKPPVTRAQLLGAVAAGILIRDGREAMEAFVAKHQDDPDLRPKDRGELMGYVFYHLGRDDTLGAAMEMLRESNDASLAGSMVLGIPGARDQIAAIDYLEAKGIPVDVSYHAFQASISKDPRYWADWASNRQNDMLSEIIQAWARDHTAEAKTWIGQRFSPNDPQYGELMFWVEDYEKAARLRAKSGK